MSKRKKPTRPRPKKPPKTKWRDIPSGGRKFTPKVPPKPVEARVKKKKHPWVLKGKEAKIPRGFEPPRETLAEAKNLIARWLEGFADCMQSHGARAKATVYVNPNDTIDAVAVVDKIPRGYPIDDLIVDGENCFHEAVEKDKKTIQTDFFIKGAVDIIDHKGRDTADRRFRGFNEYGTYWYRAHHIFDMFDALRIRAENAKRLRNKPARVRLLMHWNVINLPPGHLVQRDLKPPTKRKKRKKK